MSNIRAAYRYALAIITIAQETKKLNEITADFESLEILIEDSREFLLFLKSPVVNTLKKKRILKELVEQKVTEPTYKFLLLLMSKNREAILPEIIQQFYLLRDKLLGILNVTVKSVVTFTSQQEEYLVGQIERATKKKVRVKYVVDRSLKGGFTVQHDDTVWDASVRCQLDTLYQRFIGEASS